MNDLSSISSTVIENLNKKNLIPTPENYENEFHSTVKNQNIFCEENEEIIEIYNSLCKIEKESVGDIDKLTYRKLIKVLRSRINRYQVKQFLRDLSFFMTPSLSKDVKAEIDELCMEISNNPNELINLDNIRKLRKLTNQRIKVDKSIFNDKSEDIKKLIRFIAEVFSKTVDDNSITIEKIKNIKEEMNNLELSESSLKHIKILHEKLLDTLNHFESTVKNSNSSILNSQKETEVLYNQINELKESLNKAEEEKSIDFLTKVLTRRAYTVEIDRIENEYNIFDSNYAIVFFDIDHFKKINDTFGHECGDSVLLTFATILNKLTRSEDIICRYGGEEFVSIIHYKNYLDVKNYLNRVKNIITGNRFVYKDKKFEVKFSAGVVFRNNYKSYEEALTNADKLLYQAKNSGRNRIILDNKEVI